MTTAYTWAYSSRGLVLECSRPSSLYSVKDMVLWPSSRGSASWVIFRTSHHYLMEAIIRPTILCGSEIWWLSLLQIDWAGMERVQTLLLRCIIHCKRTIPQSIIQAEFGVHPFYLEVIFHLVSFLHRVRPFKDFATGRERYPYLTLYSSEVFSLDPPSSHARGWFSKASRPLQSMTISPEKLPLFNFSLDALRHLLPTRKY
jgi:hypothetical protein